MQWEPGERGVAELPSGRLVRGRRWSARTTTPAEHGLYALWHDPNPHWPYTWLKWPDFGLPLSREAAWAGIERAWRLAEVERVEVACGGGRGHTGTALAAMAILDGLEADAAVAWVRDVYDPGAVESPWQRGWLRRH